MDPQLAVDILDVEADCVVAHAQFCGGRVAMAVDD
jgi:hypothetical protein